MLVSVNPNDVPSLLPALFIFSKRLKLEKTTQGNHYTQCTYCCRFGHAPARCTQKGPICPYWSLHHTHWAQRCQNPTCPTGGNSKVVSRCCTTSAPHCPNCRDDHDAFSRECTARPLPRPQPQAPLGCDQEESDPCSMSKHTMEVGDDGRPAPATPEGPSAQSIDLSTPRPIHNSRDADGPPSGSRLAPTGQAPPPVTPPSPQVRPRDDSKPLLYLVPRSSSGEQSHPYSTQQPG